MSATTHTGPAYTANGKPPILDDLDEASKIDPVFKPYSLVAWLLRPPKQWAIDRILGPGDLALLYGAPGSGKTFLILDLVFAACSGGTFARRFAVARPLTCAYMASEGTDGLRDRLTAAATFYGVDDLTGLYLFDNVPQLYDAKSLESILQFSKEWREAQERGERPLLDLLVIDTLHGATAGADENSAQHMGQVLDALRRTIKLLGCAIILVHHTNKDGSSERGSSALRGAMSAMIRTEVVSGKYGMSCEKLKDAEAWKPQTYDLVAVDGTDSVRVWWDEPSDKKGIAVGKSDTDARAAISLLRNEAPRKFPARVIGELIGLGQSTQVYKVLIRAKQLDNCIQLGARDSTKDTSPHNPVVYWYEHKE